MQIAKIIKKLVHNGLFLVVLLSMIACGSRDPVEIVLRDDMNVTIYQSLIENGLSERVSIDIPEGVDSFLIEVRGSRGYYFLSEFITPEKRNLIEGASFTTRGAREIPGHINWVFPNDGEMIASEGTYKLTIGGKDAYSGRKLKSEEIEILIYSPKKKPLGTCGIDIDFLVDDAAMDPDIVTQSIDELVGIVNRDFHQIGVKINSRKIVRVNMQSSDINLGTGSARKIVDEVLTRTIRNGEAREDALHILIVRDVGKEGAVLKVAGYSMGLPGPYAGDRNTAAILVGTKLFGSKSRLNIADMASTTSHEMGHYLGLYHTSEEKGVAHDPIADTPECKSKSRCNSKFKTNIMTSSFWLYDKPQTRKNFTPSQGQVIRQHPLCVPMKVTPIPKPVTECTKSCEAPRTCTILDNTVSCKKACDPDDEKNCDGAGSCEPDDIGTYACL